MHFSSRKSLILLAGVATAIIILVSLFVVLSGSTSRVPTVLSAPTTTATFRTPITHVILIVMENAGYSNVIGNSAAPYQNLLASKYALSTQYYAATHPSLPNYVSLVAGSNLGISSEIANPISAAKTRGV